MSGACNPLAAATNVACRKHPKTRQTMLPPPSSDQALFHKIVCCFGRPMIMANAQRSELWKDFVVRSSCQLVIQIAFLHKQVSMICLVLLSKNILNFMNQLQMFPFYQHSELRGPDLMRFDTQIQGGSWFLLVLLSWRLRLGF